MSRFPTIAYVAGASLAFVLAGTASAQNNMPASQGPLEAALSAVSSASSASAITAAAQTAAQNYVATMVANAVRAAKSANPKISSAELARIANETANSEVVVAGLSAIATTATTAEIAATGSSSDANASASIAQNVAAAVNAGSVAAVNGLGFLVGPAAGSISAPQVTVAVAQKGNEVTVTTTGGTVGTAIVTSTQTVAGNNLSALRTVTIPAAGPLSGPNPIIPPLNTASRIVSPAR